MIKKTFYISNLALIVIGIYLSINLFYKIITIDNNTIPTNFANKIIKKKSNKEAQQTRVYYNTIISKNLFDTQNKIDKPNSETSIDLSLLKETKLNLKLWGTVLGSSVKSYAVIEDKKTREQNLYHTGDTIQKAKIKHILREQVIITFNGKDEILSMKDIVVKKNKSTGNSDAGYSNTQRKTQRLKLSRKKVDHALENLTTLMTQIKIIPKIKNGVPDGMMLSRIKRGSIFSSMGLRNGDILTGINDNPIESVDDAMLFYDNIQTAKNVSLQIKRNGSIRSIIYDIY